MGPFTFDALSVCSAHPTSVIQRPYSLTFLAMRVYMKFRDDAVEGRGHEVELHGGREFLDTRWEVLAPLASNII